MSDRSFCRSESISFGSCFHVTTAQQILLVDIQILSSQSQLVKILENDTAISLKSLFVALFIYFSHLKLASVEAELKQQQTLLSVPLAIMFNNKHTKKTKLPNVKS